MQGAQPLLRLDTSEDCLSESEFPAFPTDEEVHCPHPTECPRFVNAPRHSVSDGDAAEKTVTNRQVPPSIAARRPYNT